MNNPFSRFKGSPAKPEPDESTTVTPASPNSKDVEAGVGLDQKKEPDHDASSISSLNTDVQSGVHKAEVITSVWTRPQLIVAYVFVFIVFFINSFQQQTTGNLTAYVTSAFSTHSLITTIGVVSSIVGGVMKLPIAKLLDVWGRSEGYATMLFLCVIGLIMMAACNNVETYAAAQVFYWIGYNGMGYVLDVFIADTSQLKNRALLFAFSTTPFIATTFAGPAAAQDFLEGPGWRWGHGVWTIILPALSAPFLAVLWYNQRKAFKQGVLKKRDTGRNVSQSVNHWFWQLDVIGLILLCAGFVLVLLPLQLASYQANKWKSDGMIAMFVIGGLSLIAFGVYERFTKISFIPFGLLADRTVLGACFLSCNIFISFYCWDSYLSSLMQVAFNLSVKDAGYVASIYNIGACFWAVVVGGIIHLTGNIKYTALGGLCLYFLGTGLMMHFRQPGMNVGYVVMSQIFCAFGGGTMVICEQMAVMAASKHQNVAAVLAFIGLFSSVGGGIGAAISGAIWSNIFPGKLEELLPEASKNQTMAIYGNLVTQLSYEWGSPERIAINDAYGYTQKYLTIAGTATLIPCFVWILLWRNIDVRTVQQVPGRVV